MNTDSWRFYLKNQSNRTYSKEEVDHELISSVKAFHDCRPIADQYFACRQMPLGRMVEPEICFSHAQDLIACYDLVKSVPSQCKSLYSQVKTCLQLPKNRCEDQLNLYVSCDYSGKPKFPEPKRINTQDEEKTIN